MKKTQAVFAAVIIVIVAGACAGLWFLNSDTEKEEHSSESAVGSDENYYAEETPRGEDSDGEQTQPVTDSKEDVQIDSSSLNEFLSDFSRVYFCSDGEYGGETDAYDMIGFAFLHIKREDRSRLTYESRDDEFMQYECLPYEEINEVCKEYFGVSAAQESVSGEGRYDFYTFENGMFMTPAADGVGYTNLTVCDEVSVDGDTVSARFTVYSDGVSCDMTGEQASESGEKYAYGTAELRADGDGFVLLRYTCSVI